MFKQTPSLFKTLYLLNICFVPHLFRMCRVILLFIFVTYLVILLCKPVLAGTNWIFLCQPSVICKNLGIIVTVYNRKQNFTRGATLLSPSVHHLGQILSLRLQICL